MKDNKSDLLTTTELAFKKTIKNDEYIKLQQELEVQYISGLKNEFKKNLDLKMEQLNEKIE